MWQFARDTWFAVRCFMEQLAAGILFFDQGDVLNNGRNRLKMYAKLFVLVAGIFLTRYAAIPYLKSNDECSPCTKIEGDEPYSQQIKDLKDKVQTLTSSPPNFCTKEIVKVFQDFTGKEDKNANECLKRWFTDQMEKQMIENPEVKRLTQRICRSGTTPSALGDVERTIVEFIKKYDADKIDQADYALQSLGGDIVSYTCNDNPIRTVEIIILGIPIYLSTNNPEIVIQPDVYPGQCWAFGGSQGSLTIRLAALVEITGFSLEHIPRSLSPSGKINSAPKNFRVMGLKNEHDESGECLGSYIYDEKGPSVQSFKVQISSTFHFDYVKLDILSNYGNTMYTCLYRFRVHGKPVVIYTPQI